MSYPGAIIYVYFSHDNNLIFYLSISTESKGLTLQKSAVQRQTAVTAYFPGELLLLFALARHEYPSIDV